MSGVARPRSLANPDGCRRSERSERCRAPPEQVVGHRLVAELTGGARRAESFGQIHAAHGTRPVTSPETL